MNVSVESGPLVNGAAFAQARTELGGNFIRILGYFREDGVKSVSQIEEAMRAHSAAAMVLPAHTLKGESRAVLQLSALQVVQHNFAMAAASVEIIKAPRTTKYR